jgi:hypothetical protein
MHALILFGKSIELSKQNFKYLLNSKDITSFKYIISFRLAVGF